MTFKVQFVDSNFSEHLHISLRRLLSCNLLQFAIFVDRENMHRTYYGRRYNFLIAVFSTSLLSAKKRDFTDKKTLRAKLENLQFIVLQYYFLNKAGNDVFVDEAVRRCVFLRFQVASLGSL